MQYTTMPGLYPDWSGDRVSPTWLSPTKSWRQLATRLHQDGAGPFTSYSLPVVAAKHISRYHEISRHGGLSFGRFPGEVPLHQQRQWTDREAYEQYCRCWDADQAVQSSGTAHPMEDFQAFVQNRPIRTLLGAFSASYVALCRTGQLGLGGHLSPRPQIEVRSRAGRWSVCHKGWYHRAVE
jgi:hypothetical protein